MLISEKNNLIPDIGSKEFIVRGTKILASILSIDAPVFVMNILAKEAIDNHIPK